MDNCDIPAGVIINPLPIHQDCRGSLTEVYRDEWQLNIDVLQWNCLHSPAGVLRGVRVHYQRYDYLYLPTGKILLGLCDIRTESLTYGCRLLLEINQTNPQTVIIPTGVAHGFYFLEPSVILLGFSQYYTPQDEIGCLWNDPELNLPWPTQEPILSNQDAKAGTFAQMCLAFQSAREIYV